MTEEPSPPITETDQELGKAAWVRLAANPATKPELLTGPAEDPSVIVRAAVALNAAAPAMVDVRQTADPDERVGAILGRRLAGMLPTLGEEDRLLLGKRIFATLALLVEDEAGRVRASIAEAVKDMTGVPRELILKLAADTAIAVSGPGIRLSPILSEEDLLALLQSNSAPVTAIAAAERGGISEALSDAVVATAKASAVQALFANPAAAIREATLDWLIAEAASRREWQEPLLRRPRLSPHAGQVLSALVADELFFELASRAELDAGTVQELRRRVSERLNRKTPPDPTTVEALLHEARELEREGQLNEAALIAMIRSGDAMRCAVMLAVAARVPLALIERARALKSAKALVSLVWKAGFSMQVAGAVQSILALLPPETSLRAGADGQFPLSPEEMRWQIEFLERSG